MANTDRQFANEYDEMIAAMGDMPHMNKTRANAMLAQAQSHYLADAVNADDRKARLLSYMNTYPSSVQWLEESADYGPGFMFNMGSVEQVEGLIARLVAANIDPTVICSYRGGNVYYTPKEAEAYTSTFV